MLSLQPSLLPLHALQVGGAAVWAFKCQGRCGEAVPPLKTSASLYGDDFEINHQINFATSSCAVPFERVTDFMRTIGYGALLRPLRLCSAPYCPLPTAHCPLPTAHYSLLTAHCSLPTAHCSLPTAHCPLLTAVTSMQTDILNIW